MSELYHNSKEPQYFCWDRRNYASSDDQVQALKSSKTLYVGNLSFFTSETQIHEAFSVVGPVKRIIMGLNSIDKTPCGFCFVEYYNRETAAAALNYLSETICDDRVVRFDLDGGFKAGRQYGRGRAGGQIRDERRQAAFERRNMDLPVYTQRRHREQDETPQDNYGRDRKRERHHYDTESALNNGLSTKRSSATVTDKVTEAVTATATEDEPDTRPSKMTRDSDNEN